MRAEQHPTATLSAVMAGAERLHFLHGRHMGKTAEELAYQTVARLEAPEPEPQVVLVPGGQQYQPEPEEEASPTPHPATGKTLYAYQIMCRDIYKQVKRQRRFAGQSPDDRDSALTKAMEKRARREGRVV